MAEIKSTLDLVMEKTKHLSFSASEKKEQKKVEIRKVFNGLTQKFLDGKLTIAEFQKELILIEKRYDITGNSDFIEEIIDRLDLIHDNERYLVLLNEVFQIDTKQLSAILNDFRDSVAAETAKRMELIKTELQTKYAISGSAVSPNLERDSLLLSNIQDIQGKFDTKLSKEKATHRSGEKA